MTRLRPPSGTSTSGASITGGPLVLSDIRPTSPTAGTVRIGLAADTTAPSVPTGLTVTPGNTQNVVSWTASTDNVAVTGYNVRRGGTIIASPTTTTYTDTGLTNGTTYSYTVSAFDAAGNASAETSAVTGTPTAGATAPGAPTSLTGTPASTSIALTWTAPASNGGSAITDYLVEYKATSSGTWLTFSDGVSTTASATVTGLTTSTSYDFRVSAINAVGTGSPSSTYTVSTTAATTLATDNFNRTDGSGLGTSSGGQTWTSVVGALGIRSNACGAYSGDPEISVIDVSNAGVTVTATFAVINGSSAGPSLIVRLSDSSNYYQCSISTLKKVVAGATGSVDTYSSTFVTGDVMTVVCSGNTITVKRNGTQVVTRTDTFNNTATKHGISFPADVTSRVDDFSITTP